MENLKTKFSVLFVHIPKNAGSSVGRSSFVVKHASRNFSPEVPKSSTESLKVSYAICRDPYARFTSAVFNHGYLGKVTVGDGFLSETVQNDYWKWLGKFKFAELQKIFEDWVTGDFLEQYYEKFKTWDGGGDLEWPELQPQYRHVYYKDKLSVDQVGRVEDLDGSWRLVCDLAGEEYKELPRVNVSKLPEHWKYHTDKTREIVRRVYSEDFEKFGYV